MNRHDRWVYNVQLRFWLRLHRLSQRRAWRLAANEYWAEWYAHHLSHRSRREARDSFLEEATRELL